MFNEFLVESAGQSSVRTTFSQNSVLIKLSVGALCCSVCFGFRYCSSICRLGMSHAIVRLAVDSNNILPAANSSLDL